MTGLTTHVLDTANGIPAKGVKIELYRHSGGVRSKIREVVTNDDGRTDAPMLSQDQFVPNEYELLFHMGDYFRETGANISDPPFLDLVPVRFRVADHTKHFHVPLLASPWGYSTYRGS
ncbi:MAG: hydroxyisourate hydrolase [Rhodospirillaceae bacterium]|jgi:5-hydroxyisourate hydrolase|nr:hydroxyisourate hydrolase [Rhodospirillaceae bacterium]MBT5458538.1 hydroxyisourate hydrolase [Rhodospirillaceae bacterium]